MIDAMLAASISLTGLCFVAVAVCRHYMQLCVRGRDTLEASLAEMNALRAIARLHVNAAGAPPP